MNLSGQLSETGLMEFTEEESALGNRKRLKIWVVVVDSAQAHFFCKSNQSLKKIGSGFPNDDIDQGNVSEGSLHRKTDEFLKDIAEFLNNAVTKKAIDCLILAAAPKSLGRLRSFLNKDVHQRINAELDKDLTHFNEKELYNYLDKALWF